MSCPIVRSQDQRAGVVAEDDVPTDRRIGELPSGVVLHDQVAHDRGAGHGAAGAGGDDQVAGRAGERARARHVGRTGRRSRERHDQTGGERRDSGDGEIRSFHVPPLLVRVAADARIRPYRVATDRLPSRAVLEFRVLGPLEVVGETARSGSAGRVSAPRSRSCCCSANRVVPVERLADELYAGRPPVSAVTQVQRQVSELRRVLGSADAIETRPPGYLLRVRDESVRPRPLRAADRARPSSARSRGRRRPRPSRCCARRSTFGAGRRSPISRTSRSRARRCERLDELRLAALEERIDAELALGRHAALVAELEALVAEHPLRERLARPADAGALPRRDARPRRSRRTARRGRRWSRASASSRRRRCRSSSARSCMQDPALDAASRRRAGAARCWSRRRATSGSRRSSSWQRSSRPSSSSRGWCRARASSRRRDRGARPAPVAGAHRSVHQRRPGRRPRTARDRERGRPGAGRRTAGARRRADLPTRSRGCWSARRRTSPCSRALRPAGGEVAVPFGGGEHDWAALELGACARCCDAARRCGSSARAPIRAAAAATRAACSPTPRSPSSGSSTSRRRRCSPIRTSSSRPSPTRAWSSVGISPRWRHEGIGAARRALVRDARPPVLLVHRGPRPGLLAPRESRTRFTWTLV